MGLALGENEVKPGTPAWSCVAVVQRGTEFLVLSRGFNVRNPAFPGGDSEPTDESPAFTAARELYEETGVRAVKLRCIDRWVGDRNQPVFAFLVYEYRATPRLRVSEEGKPYWAPGHVLLTPGSDYRKDAERLLHKLNVSPAA